MSADIVLDIADIQRLSPGLGRRVELLAVANGVHDLVLSAAQTREKVFKGLLNWLVRIGAIESVAQVRASAVG